MSEPPVIERRPLLGVALADWKTTKVDVRALRFAPGQATGVHSHPGHVVGYIVEGTAILEVEGQPEQRLGTGAAFHEPAGARILRFDNASAEHPLRFIAIYLLSGDQPLIEMRE
jgi:mannose-6-phosphate isomerase-like protein (cupin superfamily)